MATGFIPFADSLDCIDHVQNALVYCFFSVSSPSKCLTFATFEVQLHVTWDDAVGLFAFWGRVGFCVRA